MYCGSADQRCEMETITQCPGILLPIQITPPPSVTCVFLHLHLPHEGLKQKGGEDLLLLELKILSLFTLCACFQFIFLMSVSKTKDFCPRTSQQVFFLCSLITFKLIPKQQNNNVVPPNTFSNSLAVLD